MVEPFHRMIVVEVWPPPGIGSVWIWQPPNGIDRWIWIIIPKFKWTISIIPTHDLHLTGVVAISRGPTPVNITGVQMLLIDVTKCSEIAIPTTDVSMTLDVDDFNLAIDVWFVQTTSPWAGMGDVSCIAPGYTNPMYLLIIES